MLISILRILRIPIRDLCSRLAVSRARRSDWNSELRARGDRSTIGAYAKFVVRRFRNMLRLLRHGRADGINGFLSGVSGVIHIGANIGQEAVEYHRLNLDVLWIEPIPSVFGRLCENIKAFPRQSAIQALISDRDGEMFHFRVSDNGGLSSSIFDFEKHKDIWPEVEFVETLDMVGETLPSALGRQGIAPAHFDALVLDVQGAELLVLRGAKSCLQNFTYIKTEAADFDAYDGGCRLQELAEFLTSCGFREVSRHCFAEHPTSGKYFDVVYRKAEVV